MLEVSRNNLGHSFFQNHKTIADSLREQAQNETDPKRRLKLILKAARLDPDGAKVGQTPEEKFYEAKEVFGHYIKNKVRPIPDEILYRIYNAAFDLAEIYTDKKLPNGLENFDHSCFERFINGTKQSVGLRRDIFLELAKIYHHINMHECEYMHECEAFCLFVAICSDRNNLTAWKAYLATEIEFNFPERVNKERILGSLSAIGADISPHRSYL